MSRSLSWLCGAGVEGWIRIAASAREFVGFFDAIGVGRARLTAREAGPFTAGGDEQVGDDAQDAEELFSPVRRGNVRRRGGGSADQA